MKMGNQKYTKSVAVNMVIANMIGTGIFTAIGFQVMDGAIPDAFSIIIIWGIGGVLSLCGAFAYSEVASTINRSGGEYSFLTTLYHPLAGFLSGWISLIVGFSAAIAALALATGEYFLPILGVSKTFTISYIGIELSIQKIIAIIAIILVSAVHMRGIKVGGIFQNILTSFKLLLILGIITLPFLFYNYTPSDINFLPTEKTTSTIFSLSFAGSLVWVMFSYSGWNASSYIIGDLENPEKTLPFSLIVGTIIVTVIYVLLNFVFLYVATFSELEGQLDVGNVVMEKVLGKGTSIIFSGVFSIALFSGISAMMIAGPRVAEQIGEDFKLFQLLSRRNQNGNPVSAILFLTTISCLLVLFSSFKDMIEYIGITLTIFSIMTVFGVFIIRNKKMTNKLGVKCWGYPITPVLFISLSIWMLLYFFNNDPMKILWCVLTLIPGVVIYFFSKK